MRNGLIFVVFSLFVGCTCDAPSGPAPEQPLSVETPSTPTASALRANPSSALVTGHTGVAGWSVSADGSTLFFSTERYEGGPTHMVAYWLDLTSETSTPVRIEENVAPLYFDEGGASADGRFALIGKHDGLHRIARDGSSDVLVSTIERRSRALITPDGARVAFLANDQLNVVDVASSEVQSFPLEAGRDIMLLGLEDERTLLLKVDGDVRRVGFDGEASELCADCAYDRFGDHARVAHRDDGSYDLITSEATRSIPSALAFALAPNGTVWAHVTLVQVSPYEWAKHLIIEGLAQPVDRVVDESIRDFGIFAVTNGGSIVADAALRSGEELENCLVTLHPHVRVVACEPCDSTAEHCR